MAALQLGLQGLTPESEDPSDPARPTSGEDAPEPAPDPPPDPPPDPVGDPEPSPTGPPPLVSVGLGVRDLADLDRFVASTGVTPDVVDVYEAWADDEDFDRDVADELRRRGIVPKVTWEPWIAVPSGQPVPDQPSFALRTIVAGDHDSYLRRWARQVAAYDGPVTIRLMHEMNGDWYPWSEQVNGNRPGEYVAAWRHVWGVFDAAGADQVRWEWAPNQEYGGSAALEPLYPGDAYVDRIGLSAYNWGTLANSPHEHFRWRSFAELVDPTLEVIAAFAGRPLGVAETGSSASGGDRATWITEMFDHALARELAFVNYFAMDTQRPWRFTSDPAAVEAFADGFARTRSTP